jgi:hypothetical protein
MLEIIPMAKSALITVLASLTLSGLSVAAEQHSCTDKSASEAQGRWKSGVEKGVDVEQSSIIPQSEWPAVRKRTDVYSELLRQALGEYKGYDAVGHRSVAGALFKDGPALYRYDIYMYDFFCLNGVLHGYLDKNAEAFDYASPVVDIQVNGVWDMAGPEARYIIGEKKYFQFGTPIGEIRGFPAFEAADKWVVLVSRPDKFPFIYASRKQLLDELHGRNETTRADELKTADKFDPIRPQAEQDKDREKELALFLTGAKDEQIRKKWTERFNNDYRTDEQKHEGHLNKLNAYRDKVRIRLDAVEARYTPEQLKEPAMTGIGVARSTMQEDFDFKPTKQEVCGKSPSCGALHGMPYAIPNRSYFDLGLPKSAPQFFTVAIQWSKDSVKRRDDFFEHFDFDRLVALLGK